MSATRSTREEHIYSQMLKKTPINICAFCSLKKGDEQFVSETKFFKVIKNAYPYSIWDGQGVTDHLMVIPKEHTDTIAHFTNAMSLEYSRTVGNYEGMGYNVYARTPTSKSKSVTHQHTHLIKVDGESKRLIFLMRWPFYLRISNR